MNTVNCTTYCCFGSTNSLSRQSRNVVVWCTVPTGCILPTNLGISDETGNGNCGKRDCVGRFILWIQTTECFQEEFNPRCGNLNVLEHVGNKS